MSWLEDSWTSYVKLELESKGVLSWPDAWLVRYMLLLITSCQCLDCKSRVPGGCVGLVNCTTIDWFTEWPADALYEVAAKQLADEDLGSQEIKSNMCQVGLAPSTHLYLHSLNHPSYHSICRCPVAFAVSHQRIMSEYQRCFLTALCLQSL